MQNPKLPSRPFSLEHATSLARTGVKEFEELNDTFFPIIYIFVDENPDEEGGGYRVNIVNSFPGKIIGKGGETATKLSRFLSYKLMTKVYVNASIKVDPYDPVTRYRLVFDNNQNHKSLDEQQREDHKAGWDQLDQ